MLSERASIYSIVFHLANPNKIFRQHVLLPYRSVDNEQPVMDPLDYTDEFPEKTAKPQNTTNTAYIGSPLDNPTLPLQLPLPHTLP
jgi:hypothetical protein